MKSGSEKLNERKKMILKAIIEEHVKVGEPVGSKYLTQNKQIALSSATIRNEMAELEELGYLEQPHTSAGRVPSENGYRFYVNSLMQRYSMTNAEIKRLKTMMMTRLNEIDKLLDNAAKVISSLTNYTSLAVKPRQNAVIPVHFKVVYMEPRFFLLIIMTNTDVVKTRRVNTSFAVTADLLEQLEQTLNACIAGIPPENITLPIIMQMEAMLTIGEKLVEPIVKAIYEAIREIDNGELKVDGVNLLLQYPEYSDMERLKAILGVLENKEDILNLVSSSAKDKLNVYIGSENNVDVMQNSSFVFKTITAGGRTIGAIGVLGPCRMDYSKVITTVEYLA